VADFSGPRLETDQGIKRSGPVRLDGMHWRKAASGLAREFEVELEVDNEQILTDYWRRISIFDYSKRNWHRSTASARVGATGRYSAKTGNVIFKMLYGQALHWRPIL